MIDKIKRITLPIIILITSFVIILALIPNYHPFGGLQLPLDENKILDRSEVYLDTIGVRYDKDLLRLNFEQNQSFSRWIKSENKLDSANEILRKSGLGFYWSVSQNKKNLSDVVVSSNNNDSLSKNNSSFEIKLSVSGEIIEFQQQINDTTIKFTLSPQQAQKLSIDFIQRIRSGYKVC